MAYDFSDTDNYFDDRATAAEPEQTLRTNGELSLARRIVEDTGTNLFLTGKAGTGKTTFLRRLRERLQKRMIVLAPSGVAAINAQGSTIHSFFQFPLSLYIPGQGFIGEQHYSRYTRETRRIISTLDLLVIDEISMVRADLLDAIDATLRRLRHSDNPFGGVQLLLIGDLRQLSPVVRDADRDILRRHYPSPYFFESHALKKAGFVTIELTTVYRQSDRRFIEILNAVRDGHADKTVLDDLNRRYSPGTDPETDKGFIRLTTHNRRANEINEAGIRRLSAPAVTYSAVIRGKFPESAYPAERELTLKEGAQVMFLKNDTSPERRFFNGMIGTVTEADKNHVTVQPADGSPAIDVEPAKWENARYTVDEKTKEIRQETEGAFYQLPLRLAWAITIHKSQGLTFDHAVIDAAASFAPGQAYVALSRCRSLEGIVLDSRITPEAIIVDTAVNGFIDEARSTAPDENTLRSLSEEYFRSLLADLFDFRLTGMLFNDFVKAVEEYVVPIHRDLLPHYRDAQQRMDERIVAVGERFARIYASPTQESASARHNAGLAEKIRSGCRYFIDEFTPILTLIAGTPRDLDNVAYRTRIDNAFQALAYPVGLRMRILRDLSETDFSPASYVRIKAKAVLDMENPSETPARKKPAKERKPKAEKKPKGYSRYQTRAMYLDGMTVKEIAARRDLAITTVCGHLADECIQGSISPEQLFSPDQLGKLRQIWTAVPQRDYREFFRQAAISGIDEAQARIFHKLKTVGGAHIIL